MKCKNYFCIYEAEGNCTLREVELDIVGQCKECILVESDEKILKQAKFKACNLKAD